MLVLYIVVVQEVGIMLHIVKDKINNGIIFQILILNKVQ